MHADSSTIQRRFRTLALEYEIRQLELDLEFSQNQSRLMEENIQEKQEQLEHIVSRTRHSRIMRKMVREDNCPKCGSSEFSICFNMKTLENNIECDNCGCDCNLEK